MELKKFVINKKFEESSMKSFSIYIESPLLVQYLLEFADVLKPYSFMVYAHGERFNIQCSLNGWALIPESPEQAFDYLIRYFRKLENTGLLIKTLQSKKEYILNDIEDISWTTFFLYQEKDVEEKYKRESYMDKWLEAYDEDIEEFRIVKKDYSFKEYASDHAYSKERVYRYIRKENRSEIYDENRLL